MAAPEDRNTQQGNQQEPIELRGEVRAADLDDQSFALRLDDGLMIVANFTTGQETAITEALHQHATCRLRLRGRGAVAKTGKIKRVICVDSLIVERAEPEQYIPSTKPIWEIAQEISARVPREEWAKLPKDGAKNLHHYLYGAPKKE